MIEKKPIKKIRSHTNAHNVLNKSLEAYEELVFLVSEEGEYLDYWGDESKLFAPPEKFIGKKIREIMPPDVAKMQHEAVSKVFRSNKAERIQFQLKIGETIQYFECRFMPNENDTILAIARNITPLMKAKEELIFQAGLLNNVNDAIIASDKDFKIISWNSAAKDLYGWTEEEARGHDVSQLLKTEFLDDSLEKSIQKFLDKGKWIGNVLQRHKDGTKLHVFSSVSAIKNQKGESIGAVAINRNITELVKTKQRLERTKTELERSRETLELKNKIANIFLHVHNSEVYSEVLKIVLAELESKFGIFAYLDEKGNYVCPTMTRGIWDKCKMSDKTIVFPPDSWSGLWGKAVTEKRAIFKNSGLKVPEGHIYLENALDVPIIFDNEVIGNFIVANKERGYNENDQESLKTIADMVSPILNAKLQKDKSERLREKIKNKYKELSERYEMLLESITDGVYVIDRGWNYLLVNGASADMVNMKPEELLGKNILELIPQIKKTEFFKTYERVMKTRKMEIITEKFRFSIGRSGYFEIRVYPVPEGILCIAMDITEREQVKEELEKLNTLKSDLLRDTSHELKTPLMSIKGFTELIHQEYAEQMEGAMKEYFSQIQKASGRLESLIKGILQAAELETAEEILEKEKRNLSQLIIQVLEELKVYSERKDQKVIVDIEENLVALYDETQLKQVIGGFLTNAFKYTPKKGTIEIYAKIDGNNIKFSVKDNGIGFTPAERKKVFKRFGKFEREDKDGNIIEGGTGLGLYISKKIIKLHGGEIGLNSEGKHKGSTFFFILPGN